MLAVTLLLLVCGATGGTINLLEGIIMWVCFLGYLGYMFALMKKGEMQAEEIESHRSEDAPKPDVPARLFAEDEEVEHGGENGVESRDEARLTGAAGQSRAELLESCGNEKAEAAAERAQGGVLVALLPFEGGQAALLFKEAVDGDEGGGAQHEADAVEGEGLHVVAPQHLGHEGEAPDDGGGEEHDRGGEFGSHGVGFLFRVVVGVGYSLTSKSAIALKNAISSAYLASFLLRPEMVGLWRQRMAFSG